MKYKITRLKDFISVAQKLFQITATIKTSDVDIIEAMDAYGVVKCSDYGYSLLKITLNKENYKLEKENNESWEEENF